MKIIVFGVGKYYSNRKAQLKELLCDDEIVAFIDSKVVIPECYDNIQLLPPRDVANLDFDYILLMSARSAEMEKQLVALGIERNKILRFQEYASQKHKGEINLYVKDVCSCRKKKILIITTIVEYNGGSLVAFYAAKSLKNKGYDVWLMAERISPALFKEMSNEAINN